MPAEMKISNGLDQLISDSIRSLNIDNEQVYKAMDISRRLYLRIRTHPEMMLILDVIKLSKIIKRPPQEIFEVCLKIAEQNLRKEEKKVAVTKRRRGK